MEMLGEIRAAAILTGARGEAPRDRKALAETICQLLHHDPRPAGRDSEIRCQPGSCLRRRQRPQSRRCPHHLKEEIIRFKRYRGDQLVAPTSLI